MLYALKHPGRTARYWRYRILQEIAARRHAFLGRRAALRRERKAERDLAERLREAAQPVPDRGEVVGRALIERDRDPTVIPVDAARDDRFDPRPPLAPRDADGRYVLW